MSTTFLLSTLFLTAQDLVSERQVKLEQQFIEAKREALLGKTEDAIGLFRALLEEEPDNDAILFELARLEYAAGNAGAAIDALKRGYALRPNEVYASFLAELYRSSGRYGDGAELYADLIDENPAQEQYYLERAAFQVNNQDIKEAIKTYEALEDRIGINAELTRGKHALYLGSGETKKAERELTALIEAFPRVVDYRHLLAGFYSSQEQDKEARAVYKEILEIEPADVRAQLALQDTGAVAGEAPVDDKLMALMARTDVDLDLKIGKLLPQVQQVANTNNVALADRMLAVVAELRRVHPDEAKVTAIEGDLYYHTDRLSEAAAAFRTTLELDDTVYPVWEQLLGTLYFNNDMATLREYAEEALDVFPNRPAIYVHYALGEAFRGDFGEAESLLQQAQLMLSGNPDASAALAETMTAVEAMSGSDVEVDLRMIPGGAEGPLGFYLQQREEPDADALERADHSENTNALLLELMGDEREDAGKEEEATAYYRRAKAAGSKSATLGAKLSQLN